MKTAPTNPRELDPFEAALLTELREHVAARPATETVVAEPARHHWGRWATGLAVAAATATAVVIASPGGPGASPAYAVDEDSDGDVVVTIHRLEDSVGLEAALAEHGIDADVSYDPTPGSPYHYLHLPVGAISDEGGTVEIRPGGRDEGPTLQQSGPEASTEAIPLEPGEEVDPAGCGTGDPATLKHEGDDWVLRIPADSPLHDRPVEITTSVDPDLMVGYAGDAPDSYCYVASVPL
jgi:hypothetical protein